jgi:hypothetical protein
VVTLSKLDQAASATSQRPLSFGLTTRTPRASARRVSAAHRGSTHRYSATPKSLRRARTYIRNTIVKTQTTTLPGRHDHPPQPVSSRLPARRVGLLDRAALHLGVALIKWGRRPMKADTREQVARAVDAHRARLEAERVREQYETFYLSRLL